MYIIKSIIKFLLYLLRPLKLLFPMHQSGSSWLSSYLNMDSFCNNAEWLEIVYWVFGIKPSLVAQMVKNLPALQEMWVWPLGWEDPLEKEMATDSSILAWRIPWTEELKGLQFMGLQESDMTEWLIALYILTEPKMKWVSFHASFHPFLTCHWKQVVREAPVRSPGPEESGGGWGAQLPLHIQLECGSCWLWVVGWWFMHFFIILGILEWAHCFFFLYFSSPGNNFIKIPLWSISIMLLKSVHFSLFFLPLFFFSLTFLAYSKISYAVYFLLYLSPFPSFCSWYKFL